MRRPLRDNAIGLVFGLLFLVVLAGQAVAGHADYNQQQATAGLEPISLARYVTSASFGVDVAENWQSELLAVASMVILSIYLRQRGSPQSKPVGTANTATGIEG
jgi:hypothetical protein